MVKTNNLEEYVSAVPRFNELKQSELMDCFAYYFIGYNKEPSFTAKDIQQCFNHLSIPPYSNIPQYLASNSNRGGLRNGGFQKFIKNGNEYTITRDLTEQMRDLIVTDVPKIELSKSLRTLTSKLSNPSERSYLEEGIKTFEVEAYRAAIIMVWLLTIDHLYDYILAQRLSDFNNALRSQNIKLTISSKDDFGELKEMQFIQTCRTAGIISNDVRKILEVKLGIRNSAAHPSTISFGKIKAHEFIEDLVNNVIAKY